MIKLNIRKTLLLLCIISFNITYAQIYNNNIEKKIDILISKMTLNEKIGQLSQPVLNEIDKNLEEKIRNGEVGSFCSFNKKNYTPEERNRLQHIAITESKLGIPILFTYDVIHGFSTIYPIPIALSCSWNLSYAEKVARMAAQEARNYGIDMTFSPMVDVSRDPRWGRISECYGEDVLLNSLFGSATVKGYQGKDLKSHNSIGSCVKHFVGYALSQGGRDKQYTEISKNTLLNTYLPPFKSCIDAGAISVMTAFNDISGVPATANRFTIRNILKNNWGFKGFTLSDWDAIIELKNHGIASNDKEAATCAINAGVDMEMKSHTYLQLQKAIKDKTVNLETIDDAVRRVLRVKFALGLFENPYVNTNKAKEIQLTNENRKLAREAACESMVLLKNNGILPLSKNLKSLKIEGPFANSRDFYGWWSGNGNYNDVITVYDGIKNNNSKLEIVNGAKFDNSPILLCLGEPGNHFGETNCINNIELPKSQIDMLIEAKQAGRKVIVIIFNGRPLVLNEINKYADAIIIAWHPGCETGNAVNDIIFGDVNPSGKLTCSFPKATGQIPIYYSDKTSGRPKANKYIGLDANPLFPFGYGLSYTTFDISNLELSSNKLVKDSNIEISVKVTNTGKREGKEVLQVYLHDKVASITRPKKELIKFDKISLKPNESKIIKFILNDKDLAFYNIDNKKVLEKGEYDLWVGNTSEATLKTSFTLE